VRGGGVYAVRPLVSVLNKQAFEFGFPDELLDRTILSGRLIFRAKKCPVVRSVLRRSVWHEFRLVWNGVERIGTPHSDSQEDRVRLGFCISGGRSPVRF